MFFFETKSGKAKAWTPYIEKKWNKLINLIQKKKTDMRYNSALNSSISSIRVKPVVRRHDRRTSFQFTDSFFPPREMVQHMGGCINLLELPPELVAQQLTLIDTEIFLKIELREFTDCAWTRRPEFNSLTQQRIFQPNSNQQSNNSEEYDLERRMAEMAKEYEAGLYVFVCVFFFCLFVIFAFFLCVFFFD